MEGWIVVKFVEDETVEAVPLKWLIADDESKETSENISWLYWPPYRSKTNVSSLIKSQTLPNHSTWLKFQVQVLSIKTYTTFEVANKRANKYIKYDNLSSTEAETPKTNFNKRLKRKPARYEETDEEDNVEFDDDADYPLPPTSKSTENPVPHAIPPPVMSNTSMVGKTIHVVGIELNDQQSTQRETPVIQEYNTMEEACAPTFVVSEDFQNQVLRLLNIMNCRLKDQGEILNLLLAREAGPSTTEDQTTEDEWQKVIPIKNENDLLVIEECLAERMNLEKLSREMSQVGGNNYKEFIRRILARLLADELASTYSYVGGKGKRKFCLLRLNEVVKRAVKKNSLTKEITEKDVETTISNWLAKAPAREQLKNVKSARN